MEIQFDFDPKSPLLYHKDDGESDFSLQHSPQSLQEHPEFYIEADVSPL
jgi:hypothetical protein